MHRATAAAYELHSADSWQAQLSADEASERAGRLERRTRQIPPAVRARRDDAAATIAGPRIWS